MVTAHPKKSIGQVVKFADMFSAMGTEARLRIMQLLLSAHPDGLVGGEIQQELDIPNSTLSHHLEKLKAENLVLVRRESTFLHYTATPKPFRSYYSSCTPSAALATKHSSQNQSLHVVNRRANEQPGSKRCGEGKVRRSSSPGDQRWQFLLWKQSSNSERLL